MNAEVIIVGGGVIGAACAYFLSRRDIPVLILERNHLGDGLLPGSELPARRSCDPHSRVWCNGRKNPVNDPAATSQPDSTEPANGGYGNQRLERADVGKILRSWSIKTAKRSEDPLMKSGRCKLTESRHQKSYV